MFMLTKLPLVCQIMVLENMNACELYILSTISPFYFNLISRLKIHAEISIDFFPICSFVKVTTNGKETEFEVGPMDVEMDMDSDSEKKFLVPIESENRKGIPRIEGKRCALNATGNTLSTEIPMFTFMEHLFNLFPKAPVSTIRIRLDCFSKDEHEQLEFEMEHSTKIFLSLQKMANAHRALSCGSLQVLSYREEQQEKCFFDCRRYQCVLEDIRIRDKFELSCEWEFLPIRSMTFPKLFNYSDSKAIGHSTLNALIQNGASKIELLNNKMSTEDFRMLILEWVYYQPKGLENLYVETEEQLNEMQIVGGVKEHLVGYEQNEELLDGWKIARPDGAKAMVRVGANRFIFELVKDF